MSVKIHSEQQLAIFAWFAALPSAQAVAASRHLVVRARAGTGKTYTMVEGVNRAPEARIVCTAFNKKNAEDLQAKLTNPNAEAKTFHALGFIMCKRYLTNVRIDETRGERMAQAACGIDAPVDMIRLVSKLAAKGKAVLPRGSISVMEDLAREHDLIPDEEWQQDGWTVERVCTNALKAMELARTTRDGSIDFDDMCYLPVANKWVHPRYELVVIDEAQDTNACQLRLAMGLCTKGGRVVVVGDDRQAIYAFRGADSGSLDRLKSELNAVELGLTRTYRCGKSIVAEAQRLVPDYMAAEGNPEGEVTECDYRDVAKLAQPGDFILSRSNAPLTAICMKLLRAGKRAKVEGRKVGEGLVALIKKLKAKSIPDFLKKLTAWEEKEIARAKAAAKTEEQANKKVDDISDKAECLRELASGMTGLPELNARIADLFADGVGGAFIVCSSIHRAKGRETDNVFVLEDTLKDNGIEEQNIRYVAISRAKHRLTYVQGLEESEGNETSDTNREPAS